MHVARIHWYGWIHTQFIRVNWCNTYRLMTHIIFPWAVLHVHANEQYNILMSCVPLRDSYTCTFISQTLIKEEENKNVCLFSFAWVWISKTNVINWCKILENIDLQCVSPLFCFAQADKCLVIIKYCKLLFWLVHNFQCC